MDSLKHDVKSRIKQRNSPVQGGFNHGAYCIICNLHPNIFRKLQQSKFVIPNFSYFGILLNFFFFFGVFNMLQI